MADNKKLETPLDPTEDFEDIINDSSGLTGITKNEKDSNYKEPLDKDKGSISTSSSAKYIANSNISSNVDTKDVKENKVQKKLTDNPSVEGEQSISGDMPLPGSDDDVLENAHDVGIGLDEDSEHPQELDIGSDIDKSEEAQKSS